MVAVQRACWWRMLSIAREGLGLDFIDMTSSLEFEEELKPNDYHLHQYYRAQQYLVREYLDVHISEILVGRIQLVICLGQSIPSSP